MNVLNQMQLEFPSRSANEAFARAAVACFAAQLDPNLEELNDIKTAVSEAVTNCIVHAYPDRVGPITMTLSVYPGRLVKIVVADQGIIPAEVGAACGRTVQDVPVSFDSQRRCYSLRTVEETRIEVENPEFVPVKPQSIPGLSHDPMEVL